MEYYWETSLHEGNVEESLRSKIPQWRCGEVLEEQAFLMEDMTSFFRKWREWRNTDFDSKSSMSIKGAEKDKNESTNQPTNQSINKSTDLMSIRKF